jgi:hypothetical protein
MIVTKRSTLKAYILENLSQVEVFAKLLETSEGEIEDALNGEPIVNRRRGEKNASVRLKFVMDASTRMTKIKMTDFGDRRYSGDCFDIIGIIRSIDVSSSKGFVEACKAILNLSNSEKILSKNTITISEKGITDIKFTTRPWETYDRAWMITFGLTPERISLFITILPVYSAYINDNVNPFYSYNAKEPCYVYIIGKYNGSQLVKLYFPTRTKSSKYPRFITNNPFPFDDLREFKHCDLLILVKSLKDKAVLLEHLFMIPEFVKMLEGGFTLDVRPVSSEVGNITELQARVLQGLFDLIVTNFDFDKQGCYTANTYRRQYGFTPMMLTNGKFGSIKYGAKDLTEYRSKFGVGKTLVLLKDALISLKQEYEKLTTYR